MAKPDQPDTIRVRGLENQLYLMGSQLEWIESILDGQEVSEFAMSFPIVRRVWELRQITEVEEMNGIGTVKFEPKRDVDKIIDIIREYGSESRWVGAYHTIGDKEAEDAAKSEAERLLTEIKRQIAKMEKGGSR